MEPTPPLRCARARRTRRTSSRSPLAARLSGLLAGTALTTLAVSAVALPGRGQVETAKSIQLHMHASLSENNGSMEWHAQRAQELGVDLIWWTEHDWRLTRNGYTTSFGFENTTFDGNKFTEPEENEPAWDKTFERYSFQSPGAHYAVVDTLAAQGTHSLRMEMEDLSGGSAWKQIDLIQLGSRKQNKYPLVTRPHVGFSLFPAQFDPATDQFVLHVTLSERDQNWPTLRYVIGSMDGEAPEAIPLAWTPGTWNSYDLDLVSDVQAMFTAGGIDSVRAEDNSTFELRIILRTKNGGDPIVHFDELTYSENGIPAASLLDWQRDMSSFYEGMYPGVQYLEGTEISWFAAMPHINAFAPNHTLIDHSGHVWSDSIYYAVDQVIAQDGIACLNHPWGIGIYGFTETPAQKAARILKMKRDMLIARAWGCEMVEVGYRWRHGIDLAGHLDTWDCWTGNAMFVTGVGVTDSHGSTPFFGWAPWQPIATYENNYVTWLWTTGTSETELISAMRGARAYFGDPYRWQGELDLVADDVFPMGRIVRTNAPSHSLVVRATNLPDTARVRLRQGEIRENPPVEYTDVNWLRDEDLIAPIVGGVFQDTVTVDNTLPSFVRVAIYDGNEELVFSNPIAFVDAVPGEGVAAERIAVDLEPIRVVDAEAFRLSDVSYDEGAGELTLQGDESPPGLGVLVVEPGPLGAPSSVSGAASWTYDAGRLTLLDFGGAGAEIHVLWGSVDGPVPGELSITTVAMAPGRPNPFGRGLVVDYALPASAPALLEVLDVAGRRIRILEDGFLERGAHRVTWDGRDESGRAAANGVYFVRLRALGEVRVTKAVKLR